MTQLKRCSCESSGTWKAIQDERGHRCSFQQKRPYLHCDDERGLAHDLRIEARSTPDAFIDIYMGTALSVVCVYPLTGMSSYGPISGYCILITRLNFGEEVGFCTALIVLLYLG